MAEAFENQRRSLHEAIAEAVARKGAGRTRADGQLGEQLEAIMQRLPQLQDAINRASERPLGICAAPSKRSSSGSGSRSTRTRTQSRPPQIFGKERKLRLAQTWMTRL